MSEWNPSDPPQDAPAGGTMVAVPRVGQQPRPATNAPRAPEAGGTMVGIGRVAVPGAAPAPSFGTFAMPPSAPTPAPEAGGTMVGIGRVHVPAGGFGAPAQSSFSAPEAGGTMVGIGRVNLPGAAPGFGGMAMPLPGTASAQPSYGAPEAGGTMVGMARVGAPMAQGFGAPTQPSFGAPEPGGTMVGMARVGAPMAPAFGFAPPAPARPTGPPPGYEIIGHLGGGDLGQVFHVRHLDSGGEYALRILRPDIVAVPGALEALRDVVALARNAAHTHLGQQFVLEESASPSLVVEYVPGKQLAALMKERGSAPAPAVIDLGVRLCSALAAGHGAGLAHGRVHAGNVMLEAKTGRWVLLDLGHAYAVQALEPAHDLYALGALLYEMATGHSPFEGSAQPVPDPRTWKPYLPAGLSALLLRTLAADPALWFDGALELAQALARAKNQP